MPSLYVSTDSLIIKVNEIAIALKPFSVHRGKQNLASLKKKKKAFSVAVKRPIELMDPGNYRGRSDKIKVSS